ncbi:hypothetical protein BDV37DRAFT_277857 [Aspergillus pseudonomiae]|uniref:DUF1214 domain-containing protein n=1 Tax=Aspergillus pseudonomiae TaxID=1506151 RepID=A0A5N7DSY4_9EURO|nr:uncharacterized protein BDV37DRAFT_277857 [Aspergillus pseudonomiae]KAE8409514.1 hypothetical protein BDV37DRAFT_277857 [Aspergillus pseudonomiae]
MNVSLSSDEPAKALQLMARMAPFNPPRLAPRVHKNYAMRLYVAYTGYLCLMASEALYPFKPPLATGGFWSLTEYNSQKFLIDRPLGRYSVRDRTDLAYPDRTPVYEDRSSNDDGSFQVLIQPADKRPPANWTSNWLPIQSGGGDFELACERTFVISTGTPSNVK